jgi:tRNA-2-methylthio-N6-dimethylallyladenosine synthase
MTWFFETYGCQMNSAESAALALVCAERGWERAANGESADLVLLNTCSVRLTAEKRAMGRIALYASLKRKQKFTFTLVVAGCMAQGLGEKLKEKFPEIDYVMGTAARSFFPLILEAVEKGEKVLAQQGFAEEPVFSFSPSHLEEGQFRSFVPIMHGCNNFCSYCVVPYVRGREVSRNPLHIKREIRHVGERGVKEITLLGQNVNSYWWEEGGLDFAGLLQIVAAEAENSGVKRLRFLSANPGNFSHATVDTLAGNAVFCRHIHLPVQHGSNRILKAMNRGYTVERYRELVGELRQAMPGITFSTDILIGFPGETEEDVEETLALMEEVKFLYSYMYHFNPREGTAAFDLSGRIDEGVKRRRLSRVIALQKKHTTRLLQSRIGSREQVLVEGISRKNADELITRTEKDEMAAVQGPASLIGSFAMLTLSDLRGNTFRAEELQPCRGD